MNERGLSLEEAVAYSMRWRLVPEQVARHGVRFVTDPAWRAYATTYTEGYRLCKGWADDGWRSMWRLLTEQLTTADLAGSGEGRA